MKNFDIQNSVNPFLIERAYILYDGEVHQVFDMDKQEICISKNSKTIRIGDDEWQPIILDNDWLSKLRISLNQKIRNPTSGADWIIKVSGKHYYFTIYNSIAYGDNPVIPLRYVHNLQEWHFRLTGITIE